MPEPSTPPEVLPDLPEDEQSSLAMLRRDLYARDESAEITARNKEISDLRVRRGEVLEKPAAPEKLALANEMEKRRKQRLTWIKRGLVGALLLAAFAGAVWATVAYRQSRELVSSQIEVRLEAPVEVVSGEIINYRLALRNGSKIGWSSVTVLFTPPEGFAFGESSVPLRREGRALALDAAAMQPGEESAIEISGQLVGESQASALAQAEAIVSPENFPNSEFRNTATAASVFRVAPLEISVEASAEAASGDRLVAVFHVRNTGSQPLQGVRLKLQVPVGMQLALEDEATSAEFSVPDSAWNLPELPVFAEVVRTAVLYVQGEAGERRILGAQATIEREGKSYLQREVTHVISVASSELLLEQEYNGSTQDQVVTSGQKVAGVLKLRNTGTKELANVVARAEFQGTGFDSSSLKLPGGAYDPLTRTITWTSASVPSLARVLPGAEVVIAYDFDIFTVAELTAALDVKANNALVIVATADSPDLPKPVGQEARVVQHRAVLSVATDMTLAADAFYDDGRLGLTSTGPVPPRVSEQTTYTVRFRAGSTLNDAGEVKLVAVLPDGVGYTGQNYLTVGSVDFNDRTGELVWQIPLMAGLTGVKTPPAELHVQVSITPGENSRGKVIEFLNKAVLTGVDQYTDKAVSASMTQFPSTETASPQKGKVE